MKNSELAEKAAELIQENGHTKGFYRDEHGLCLLGAFRGAWFLFYGSNVDVHDKLAVRILSPVLDVKEPPLGWPNPVLVLNDSQGFNKDKALDLLGRAAKHWRNLGQ